jgi:acetylornithine deacetylase/succinyl-diaminopimelate desuccinylase-like protein
MSTAWFDELAEFIRIPSISAEPEHKADVITAGNWVVDRIRQAGGEAELVDWHGQPLAIGEVRASTDPENAPTVLVYAHFDVQPSDPDELWESPAFELEIRDDRVYARGIADDKGHLFMLLKAARELADAGTLPINVRFACDGEEETGGNSIVEWVEADDRGADAAIVFDGGMIGYQMPCFEVATRGLVYFHVTVTTGERDLHSGIFGGAALNAGHALIEALSTLTAKDGRLAEPLREGIVAPTAQELEDWKLLPDGGGELAAQGARPMDAKAAEEFYLRTFAEPTFEVNGILSGSPTVEKTVLPIKAEANVSIRLAPGQKGEVIAPAFERLIREALPEGADITIEHMSSARSGVVNPDADAIRLGQDAFEQVLGVRPALIRTGGSIPIVAALSAENIPTIISGMSLPDAGMHSPNENMRVEYMTLGVDVVKAMFTELGKL